MIKLTEKGGFRREPWFPFQLEENGSETRFFKNCQLDKNLQKKEGSKGNLGSLYKGFKRGLSSPLFVARVTVALKISRVHTLASFTSLGSSCST